MDLAIATELLDQLAAAIEAAKQTPFDRWWDSLVKAQTAGQWRYVSNFPAPIDRDRAMEIWKAAEQACQRP